MDYSFYLTDNSGDTLKQAITEPLVAFNNEYGEPSNRRILAIPIEDTNKKVIGGLYGRTAFQWLFIEILFVPEFLRGNGLGKKLVETAEKEALARGCHNVWLDTFEFQAKGFYETMGYREFGELQNFPNGFSRFFLKKSLE